MVHQTWQLQGWVSIGLRGITFGSFDKKRAERQSPLVAISVDIMIFLAVLILPLLSFCQQPKS